MISTQIIGGTYKLFIEPEKLIRYPLGTFNSQ